MLCNIKPVPFYESDKHIFAKIPVGGSGPPVPPSGSAHVACSNYGPNLAIETSANVKT